MLSVVSRLETAATGSGTVTFVGAAAGDAGPVERVEWAQLHDDARGIAAALAGAGRRPGGARRDPRTQQPRRSSPTIQATLLAGGTVVALPLPMRLGSIEEFVDQTRVRIANADAALVVVDPDLAPFLDPAPAGAPVVLLDELAREGARAGAERWARPADDPERLAILQFTSGSTAEPKGVMLPDRCIGANIDAIVDGRADHPRRRRGVVAAAVPRHGPHRAADDADAPRASSSCSARRRTSWPGPACWLRVDLGVPRHHHRRAQLRVCARGAGVAARRAARPVVVGGSRSTAPSPSTRARSRRSAPRRAATGSTPSAAFPVFGMAEATLGVTFPAPGTGMTVDARRPPRARARAVRTSRRAAADAASGAAPGAARPHRCAGFELRIVRSRDRARSAATARSASSSCAARR